jgi:hypothetical protein
MVKPVVLTKVDVEKDPSLIWNTFNDMMATNELSELTKVQVAAQLVWRYDSEVQNGGHLQFFENSYQGNISNLEAYVGFVIKALTTMGIKKQAKILEDAAEKYFKERRKHATTVEEFVELEKEEEFEKYDNKYYKCSPEIMDYLEKFLQSHQNEFVELV